MKLIKRRNTHTYKSINYTMEHITENIKNKRKYIMNTPKK